MYACARARAYAYALMHACIFACVRVLCASFVGKRFVCVGLFMSFLCLCVGHCLGVSRFLLWHLTVHTAPAITTVTVTATVPARVSIPFFCSEAINLGESQSNTCASASLPLCSSGEDPLFGDLASFVMAVDFLSGSKKKNLDFNDKPRSSDLR